MLKLLVFLSIFCFFGQASAYERADAFIVRAYNKSYKILSPPGFKAKTNLIVENKTTVKLLGKVKLGNGKTLGHMSIKPGSYQTTIINMKKNERVYFVPLSPPFQKFELKFGSRPYEIPPKR